MATDSRSKKRKSVDNAENSTKKVKTAPSADKPAPLKSALKKSTVETTTSTKKADGKTTKTTTKAKKTGNKPAKKTTKTSTTAAAEDSSDDEAPTKPAEPDLATSRELTAAQTADLLAGFSSSEEDEDAGSDDEADGIALSKLPTAPTTDLIQKKIASSTDPDAVPGTIHLSRLPHGFFETQMRAYFAQFGTITHLRLARNRKTGKSKHFAFIEFASSGVADIVAKTMDKYLMFGHILQARRVPEEQIGEAFWRGEGRKRVVPRNRLEGARLRRGMGREGWEKRVTRESEKREEKAGKLKELGYEFDMPQVRGVGDVPVQKVLGQAEAGAEEAPKAVEAAEEDASEEVVRTVQAKPGKVEVTEEKTKKRPAGKEAKIQKAKKVKKSAAVAA